MIPSRRTTVGLILFQDTVNATMMKLFKIWCSLCHTECIDIYSAITSFPIFLPNQPMLMFQCVCRIQFHQGQGWGEICLKQVLLLCPLGTLLFYCHPSMANGLSAVALGIARKDQTHRWKCDKIRFLCCVESAGVSPPTARYRCSSVVFL